MAFEKPIPISYKQPGIGKRRKLRTGYCIPYTFASETDRPAALAFADGLVKVFLCHGLRVGESDDSVDLYVMDTPLYRAVDTLALIAEAIGK